MNKSIVDRLFSAFILFLKGIATSFGFIVPGLSGGTMALIAGIYHKLLSSVNGLLKNFKKNALFLVIAGAGALFGIFAFSGIISHLLENYKIPVTYFFMGCVAGGIPLLLKESKIKRAEFKKPLPYIWILAGLIIVIAVAALSKSYFNISATVGALRFILFLAVGLFVAAAFILPGISTTAFLEAIGIYSQTLDAINNMDIMFLLPILLGAVIGIIAMAKLFEVLLEKKPQATYMVITGFVIGSFIEIYPGIPAGADILWSLITLTAGIFTVLFLTNLAAKSTPQTQSEE